jgi:hypothetical protein
MKTVKKADSLRTGIVILTGLCLITLAVSPSIPEVVGGSIVRNLMKGRNVLKGSIRRYALACLLVIVPGGGAIIGFYRSTLSNQHAAFATTLDALADSRRIADDYRRELVEELARTLPEIARIVSERERALAAVRFLRGIFDQLRKTYYTNSQVIKEFND